MYIKKLLKTPVGFLEVPLIGLCVCIVLISSCRPSVADIVTNDDLPPLPADAGMVVLRIAGTKARTIFPDGMSGLAYTALCTDDDGIETEKTEALPGGSGAIVLKADTNWTITIEARDGGGVLVGTAEVTAALADGEIKTFSDIYLRPITGNGILNWSVTFPDHFAYTQTKLIYDDGEIDLNAANNGNLSLASGSYVFRAVLEAVSGRKAGKTEAVHIYPNMATTFVWSFAGDDFITGTSEVFGWGAAAHNGAGPILVQPGWTRYESENTAVASIHNSTRTDDVPPGSESNPFYSGGKAAGGFNKRGDINAITLDQDWDTLPGTAIGYVKFTVNVPQAGRYRVDVIYNGDDDKAILVKLNDYSQIVVSLPRRVDGGLNHLFTRQLILGDFKMGTNTIWVSGAITPDQSGWANIDCIDIKDTPQSFGGGDKVEWDAVAGATVYEIHHSGSRLGTYTYLAAVTGITEYTHANPNPKKYENYYKIIAKNAAGAEIGEHVVSRELALFGPNVKLYDAQYDTITNISTEINQIGDEMYGDSWDYDESRNIWTDGQFSHKRHSLFFKPGDYPPFDTINIGFYTSIAGLGKTPSETILRGTINTPAHLDSPNNPNPGNPKNNATCTFWRSIENFRLAASAGGTMFRWAVSQAAPARRMQVEIPTYYHMTGGWASGGFTADCRFTSTVDGGSQQQWYTRNSHHQNEITGVSMNKVVQGTTGNVPGSSTNARYTKVDDTPVIREKPFLYYDENGDYKVFVPALRYNAVGTSWNGSDAGYGQILDLVNDFYVAKAGDTAAAINTQLAAGKNIYFTPGLYRCEVPIRVTRPGTILLGNGYPTLYPQNSYGALFVDNVDGVTVAGLMFDATNSNSIYLLAVGDMNAAGSGGGNHAANPTLLADIFLRVGGYHSNAVRADISALINSNNVIGDHFWVWRADHGNNNTGASVGWTRNVTKNGMVVRGDDVTMYGLFVEHYHEYNTLWMGDRGKTYFYQNEAPYDPANQAAYRSHNGTVDGWSQYKVANNVTEHLALGVGMYCVFQGGVNGQAYIENAAEVPHRPNVRVISANTIYIGNSDKGGIRRIINGTGRTVENSYGPGNVYVREFVNGVATLPAGEPVGTPTQGVAPGDEDHLTWLMSGGNWRNLLP